MSGANNNLMLFKDDIGKKVYEIEEEITYVVKTQVIAKDDDEAHKKYLDCSSTVNSENYQATDNGCDVVNSYAKEYSEIKNHREIGTIQREDEQDDDSLLEVA